MSRFAEIIPTDNVYYIKTIEDLPDIFSPWVMYNLQYRGGVFFSPDGASLVPVGADEALIYFMGE